MKSRRDQLLGYLLGALDAAETRQVEEELDKNPALRVEMARFQELLSRLGMDEEPEEFDPPRGLAERACDFVVANGEDAAIARAAPAFHVHLSSAGQAPGESSRGYSLTDVLVACWVLLTMGALLFPSLNNMRLQAQRATCQYRLVQTGAALWDFAQLRPDRKYPLIPENGNFAVAGYVPFTLRNAGFVPEAQNLLCPAARQSERLADLPMPSVCEIESSTGPQLRSCQQRMGGTYAYNMGFWRDNRLVPAVLLARPGFALIADAPGDQTLPPHDGLGLNVLYEDGHVRFLPLSRKPRLADDPFHNRNGYIAAGLDSNDAALGSSDARPLPFED